MERIFTIPSGKLVWFKEKTEEYNKKCDMYGLNRIVYNVLKKYISEIVVTEHTKGTSFKEDRKKTVLVEFAVIQANVPGIITKNGKEYRYIGKLYNKDNVWKCDIIDKTRIDDFKWRDFRCDHCGTVRNREKYFFFDDNGKTLHIGSKCAKDFFGIDTENALNYIYETFRVFDNVEDEEYIGRCFGTKVLSFNQLYEELKTITEDFTKWNRNDISCNLNNLKYIPDYENKESNDIKQEMIKKYSTEQTQDAINIMEFLSVDYITEINYIEMSYHIYNYIKECRIENEKKRMGVLGKCPFNYGDLVTIYGSVIKRNTYIRKIGYRETPGVVVKILSQNDNVPYVVFTTSKKFFSLEEKDNIEISAVVGDDSYDSYIDHIVTCLRKPKILNITKHEC